MNIQADSLRRLIAAIFTQAGCPADEGARIGNLLVAANLAGHDSHGVIRVPRYVQGIADGRVKPGQHISVVTDGGAFAVVDGNYGFGQTVAPEAVALGIEKARAHGIAIVALRNAGHIGRAGDFAEMAAEADQVSIHFVNVKSSLLVAPFGGAERRMSTAPIAIGVPVDGRRPVILDFATSQVAEGKALVALNGGKKVPEGSFVWPDGRLSDDPRALYGEPQPGRLPNPIEGPGALRAMGEHKGSGLALMCELLGGAFTGNGCAGPPPRPHANGMLSIYLSRAAFQAGDGFAAEARQYIDYVKSAKPVEPDGEVLMPGEPEDRKRAQHLRDGVPLQDQVWESILATARKVGLDQGRIDALLSPSEAAA